MKISVVTYHLPHPAGTATGRHVFAIWDAAREMGHDVSAWCWGQPPDGLDPPGWVRCERYHDPGGWRRLPSTLVHPRGGLASVGWQPSPDAVAWAEEPESYAAVARAECRGVTVYHSTLLDAIALRRPRPADVQSIRAERRAVRGADVAIAFSPRVANVVGIDNLCPVTLPIPDEALPIVTEPVAVMIADWAWPPNRLALRQLLDQWPAVRSAMPEARLLLAGRGFDSAGSGLADAPGVQVLGEVPQTQHALRRAAVFVFPCPPTSGPKMKVLDAMAWGTPVLTTRAGIEGLDVDLQAVAVRSPSRFADELVGLFRDPARRRRMAETGRSYVLGHHQPRQAATKRLALIDRVGDHSR
jgi:glycosyltransferase involved in cell wall biosynthesis